MDEFNTFTAEAIRIYDSNLPWDTKYDLIFSENISRKIFSLVRLDYYDPDTTYEEDVKAFISALKEKAGIHD